MGKIIKAEKRGGGIESKVIEEYTPLNDAKQDNEQKQLESYS